MKGRYWLEYKLSVVKLVSSLDLMYTMVTIINNNVYLKFSKRVDFRCSYIRRRGGGINYER